MRFFIRSVFLLFAVIFLVIIHLGTASFFSFPWSAVNLIVAACILLLMKTESGMVVWMAFFCHFFVELYTKTPFGIVLAAGTVGMLFTYWLSQYIFTNKSWYTACVLTISAIALYRGLYSIGIWLLSSSQSATGIAWPQLMVRYLAEGGLTMLLVLLLYLIVHYFSSPPDTHRYRIAWYE